MEEKSEIIKIDASCLNSVKQEIDSESIFRYFNIQFILSAILLIIVFSIQLYYGLPTDDKIDMNNFTYRFSNYQEGGNTYGIFTSMFLHGSFGHLFSNLVFLYPFTLITSSVVKNYIFGGVIFITGMIAGNMSYILNDAPSIGASGWIFGIFGFLTPYYLYYRHTLSSNVQDLPWVFLFLAVYTIGSGLDDPMIDNVGHIGGFISGICYGFIYFRYYFEK